MQGNTLDDRNSQVADVFLLEGTSQQIVIPFKYWIDQVHRMVKSPNYNDVHSDAFGSLWRIRNTHVMSSENNITHGEA